MELNVTFCVVVATLATKHQEAEKGHVNDWIFQAPATRSATLAAAARTTTSAR